MNPSDGCCGVLTTCCGPEVNMVLNVSIMNACGTFTGTLGWNSNARSGAGAWVGTISIKCKPNLFAPCNTSFTVINMTMYCTPSGYTMDTDLGSGDATGTICSPFSTTYNIPITGCAPQQVFKVSE